MTNQSILILAENQIDIDEPSSLIGENFGTIYSSTDEKTARELLEKYKPSFLVFNFDSAKKSLRLYQKLVHDAGETQDFPHTAILLCIASDLKVAYQLCEQEIFDDYIIFKPLYDPYRLRLMLQSTISTSSLKESWEDLSHQITAFGQKAKNQHRAIQQSTNRSRNALEKAESVYANLGVTVIEAVNSLSSQLASSNWKDEDAVKILTPELFQQRFGDLAEQCISTEFQQAENSLRQIMEQWTESIKSDVTGVVELLEGIEVASDAGAASKKILVIEDDEIYSGILKSLLEGVGYDVTCEYNGENGFNRMAVLQPGHVLLDYELPDMTGLDVLKKAQNNSLLKHIPITMLTGHNNRDVVQKCIMHGAKDFIAKPASRVVILSKLQGNSTPSQTSKG